MRPRITITVDFSYEFSILDGVSASIPFFELGMKWLLRWTFPHKRLAILLKWFRARAAGKPTVRFSIMLQIIDIRLLGREDVFVILHNDIILVQDVLKKRALIH